MELVLVWERRERLSIGFGPQGPPLLRQLLNWDLSGFLLSLQSVRLDPFGSIPFRSSSGFSAPESSKLGERGCFIFLFFALSGFPVEKSVSVSLGYF